MRRLLDILLGRSAPPAPKLDALFALSTAYVTLVARLGMHVSGRAGIVFRPAEGSAFDALRGELEDLLKLSAAELNSRCTLQKDEYGFLWVVIEDEQLEDQVATVHLVSSTLSEHGYGPFLLAAAFRFAEAGQSIYWIYNYKRGRFYPFAPRQDQRRDNAKELRLKAILEGEIPIEPQLERWYPLWGLPV